MRFLLSIILVVCMAPASFAGGFTFANLDWAQQVDTAKQVLQQNLGDNFSVSRPINMKRPIENNTPGFFGPRLFPIVDSIAHDERTSYMGALMPYQGKYCHERKTRSREACTFIRSIYSSIDDTFGIFKISVWPKGKTLLSGANLYFVNPRFPNSSIAGRLAWVSVTCRVPRTDYRNKSPQKWPPETEMYRALVSKYGPPQHIKTKVAVVGKLNTMPTLVNYCEWGKDNTYMCYLVDAKNLASPHIVIYYNAATMEEYQKAYSQEINAFVSKSKQAIESKAAALRDKKEGASKKATKAARDNI